MCHVSHLTDASLGVMALSLAACVTAGSSTGDVCVSILLPRAFFHSFPIFLSENAALMDDTKGNYAQFRMLN